MKVPKLPKFQLLTCLLVAFIVLRCDGAITWPWWAVLSPLWAPPALTLSFLLTGGAVLLLLRGWRS